MVSGVTAIRSGGAGKVQLSRSAEPDFDVEARLPCLLKRRREEPRMEDVVEMLNV
jgi:hypothetical protein